MIFISVAYKHWFGLNIKNKINLFPSKFELWNLKLPYFSFKKKIIVFFFVDIYLETFQVRSVTILIIRKDVFSKGFYIFISINYSVYDCYKFLTIRIELFIKSNNSLLVQKMTCKLESNFLQPFWKILFSREP